MKRCPLGRVSAEMSACTSSSGMYEIQMLARESAVPAGTAASACVGQKKSHVGRWITA